MSSRSPCFDTCSGHRRGSPASLFAHVLKRRSVVELRRRRVTTAWSVLGDTSRLGTRELHESGSCNRQDGHRAAAIRLMKGQGTVVRSRAGLVKGRKVGGAEDGSVPSASVALQT